MRTQTWFLTTLLLIFSMTAAVAQDDDAEDRDQLRIAALEALMSAPPEFALPRVRKILEQDNSNEVKESALFILSQIDDPEAHSLLLETAQSSSGDLQIEAIQMLGISGDTDSLANLHSIYESGDSDVREAVLEAFMIADDSNALYELALKSSGEDFDAAVEMLGAMGASEELRKLREQSGVTEGLIEAYAISGDFDSLVELANDGSDSEMQIEAIESLGIVGGDNVGATLVSIYRSSEDEDIKDAALDGMLIAGYDTGVLELYRASDDKREKRELLEYLSHMNSDALLEIIDDALEGER